MELSVKQILQAAAEPVRRFELIADRDLEPDAQEQSENYNFDKPLEASEFSVARGWVFSCRVCGAKTHIFTKKPNCNHCGFSQLIKGRDE